MKLVAFPPDTVRGALKELEAKEGELEKEFTATSQDIEALKLRQEQLTVDRQHVASLLTCLRALKGGAK